MSPFAVRKLLVNTEKHFFNFFHKKSLSFQKVDLWSTINSDFENGLTLPIDFIITDETNVEGWSTTATDNQIELWKSGFKGVPAQNGTYFAELNANQSSALYQRILHKPRCKN